MHTLVARVHGTCKSKQRWAGTTPHSRAEDGVQGGKREELIDAAQGSDLLVNSSGQAPL